MGTAKSSESGFVLWSSQGSLGGLEEGSLAPVRYDLCEQVSPYILPQDAKCMILQAGIDNAAP